MLILSRIKYPNARQAVIEHRERHWLIAVVYPLRCVTANYSHLRVKFTPGLIYREIGMMLDAMEKDEDLKVHTDVLLRLFAALDLIARYVFMHTGVPEICYNVQKMIEKRERNYMPIVVDFMSQVQLEANLKVQAARKEAQTAEQKDC